MKFHWRETVFALFEVASLKAAAFTYQKQQPRSRSRRSSSQSSLLAWFPPSILAAEEKDGYKSGGSRQGTERGGEDREGAHGAERRKGREELPDQRLRPSFRDFLPVGTPAR